MKNKLFNALSIAIIMAMLLTNLAMADNTQSDGDGVVSLNDSNMVLGDVCAGSTTTRSVPVFINRTGSNANVYKNGSTVTVSVLSTSGVGLSAVMGSPNTIVLPSDWDEKANNFKSDVVYSTVTFVAGSAGAFSGSVNYRGSGVNSSNTTINRDDTMLVTATVINCDSTPPVITPVVVGTLGLNGWYTSNVSLTWTVSDSESAVTSTTGCGPSSVNTDTTGQTFTCSATSAGGTNTQSVTLKRDSTAPGISFVGPSTSPWYNADVTAGWSCSDALSGVTNASVGGSTGGEGAAQSATGTCTDNAGNTASNTQYFMVDKTTPSISGSAAPAANSNGWNNTDVLISFLCSDGLSGLSSCGPDVTLSAEGANQSATGNVADNAGNTASATVSGINIDKTVPTVSASASPATNGHGWNNSDVTVTFSGSDALSGIDSCDAPAVLSSDGAGQSTSGACFDKAGNSASATASGINIDKTAPAVTVTPVRSPDHNGWYNTPVDFDTSGSDGTSGIDTCSPLQNYSAPDGTGLTVNGSCTDFAGNTGNGTSNPFNFDNTDPSISVSLDRSPVGAWFNISTGAPIAQFTCSDATSGYVSCPADYIFPQGADLAHEGMAFDYAGNSASASVNSVYVDLTAPSVIWDPGVYANGSVFYFGFVPAWPPNPCVADDALSGPASCAVTGSSTDIGTNTLIATAYDVAGNSTVETRSYEVKAWTFSGFYQPVDMGATVWNTVKGGSTVPFKFEAFAGSMEITDTSIVKSFNTTQVMCSGGTEDTIELVATGGTSLRYDWISGQFIYNWQTPKEPGFCYKVTFTLQDGSTKTANFKLK